MKLVNFNIEWMNNWFVGGDSVAFRKEHSKKGVVDISDVQELATRVARLILDADPDILAVEEGPSALEEMKLFVSTFLSNAGAPLFEVFGGIDGQSQRIYILVKRDGKLRNARLSFDPATLSLKDHWDSDVNGDNIVESYKFTRLPIVVEGDLVNGQKCTLVAMHTKSNFVQFGEELWKNPATRQKFVDTSVMDRRRISSEAMRMRRYLDTLIEENPHANIIVAGDLNDGPGMDYFELRYLTHNVIDIIMGSTFDYESLFYHAFVDRVPRDERYTVEFYDFVEEKDRRLLLDHIVVSPALKGSILSGGILHGEYDGALRPDAVGDRQRRPSDHRPVFVELRD